MGDAASAMPRGKRLSITVDGASSNPRRGRNGAGVVVELGGVVIAEISEETGMGTNNEAEYKAVIRGLEEAIRLHREGVPFDGVDVNSDSRLVVQHLTGTWAVQAVHLRALYIRTEELVLHLGLLGKEVRFNNVIRTRSRSRRADMLAGVAIGRADSLQNALSVP
ncbi:MAG: reverse transcriptase-like protein [Thermoplasmatota archaeon]